MDFKEYQRQARTTAIYPKKAQVIYPALGLSGEVGELLNKLKKVFRDHEATELSIHTIPANTFEKLSDELGDILWYLSNFASDLNLKLDQIAEDNLLKLFDRKDRGVLKGDGDVR